jgi:hypothetical protein
LFSIFGSSKEVHNAGAEEDMQIDDMPKNILVMDKCVKKGHVPLGSQKQSLKMLV